MLKSPFDDFSDRTLTALPGTLSKLEYVAGLRQADGDYSHWGLAHTHGESAANVAIAQAHSEVFRLTLRTPLSRLWEEIRSTAKDHGGDVRQFARQLIELSDGLIPKDLKGGSPRHFNSVLQALSALATSPVQ